MEAAEYLRQAILGAFRNSKEIAWPPTADDLDYSPPLPPELKSFLKYVISGSNTADCCKHVKRIILSTGQDICHGVSNVRWKLPKHILLASTIRHLYRGKKLVTIINRLGHCGSNKYISELDKVIVMALEDVSSLVTSQIVSEENNKVFHLEWNYLNKVTKNIYGNNVVNHEGGIMIQKAKTDIIMNAPIQETTLPLYSRADSRHVAEKIPPFQLYKKTGPKFLDTATYKHPDINKTIYDKCLKEMQVWFLAPISSSGRETQLIPAFGGLTSATGSSLEMKSKIDYFTPMDQPFTDSVVVRELLKRLEKTTDAVGQQCVLNTFDQGGLRRHEVQKACGNTRTYLYNYKLLRHGYISQMK